MNYKENYLLSPCQMAVRHCALGISTTGAQQNKSIEALVGPKRVSSFQPARLVLTKSTLDFLCRINRSQIFTKYFQMFSGVDNSHEIAIFFKCCHPTSNNFFFVCFILFCFVFPSGTSMDTFHRRGTTTWRPPCAWVVKEFYLA